MFKKYTKGFFDKEVVSPSEHAHDPALENHFANPYFPDASLTDFSEEAALEESAQEEEPETIIGEAVSIKGTLAFKRLVRIDGSFEGELLTEGKLIVGPTGSVKANLTLDEAFISGKVEGNIQAKTRLVLRGRAEIRGDITTPLLSVDEGVSIVGLVEVSSTQQTMTTQVAEQEDYFSKGSYLPEKEPYLP